MVKFLIQRPIAVTVTFIAIIVMGLVSAGLIPVSLMPDVDIPEIIVKVSVPEKPTREVEEYYVKRIRQSLLQVSHLDDIQSTSSNGQGYVRLLFNYGTDINYAFIEVNEKIDALMHQMPDDLNRPAVIKTSATDIPVFYLNVSVKDTLDKHRFMELTEFSEQIIKKRIEQLPEVAMVDISGSEYPEIVLNVDLEKLKTLGIDESMITNALESNNLTVGNIKVRNGLYEFNVRYSSLLRNVVDIENLFVSVNNRIFRLNEIAEIKVRSQTGKGVFISGKRQAIVMAVIKKSNARMADLKEQTNGLLKIFRKDYPRLKFEVDRNQTELLDYSIGNLRKGLIVSGLLAFLIMFIFLKDIKSPILIGISVPVSLVISLLFFFLFNISINIISLSGLILGVGMMIDNSIIVIDNIFQYREKGFSVSKSCIKGTNEVIRPLISSVLTTCAVFVPLIFLSGISGALFYDQAMAITIGLGTSLIVSFTLIPVYFGLFYRKETKGAKKQKNRFFEKIRIYNHIEDSYSRGFNLVFKNSKLFILGSLVLMAFGAFVFMQIKKEKFPVFKQTEAIFSIDWNKNITVEENHRRINQLLKVGDTLFLQASCMIGEQGFILDKTNQLGSSQAQLYVMAANNEKLGKVIYSFQTVLLDKYPEAIVDIQPPETIFEKVFSNKGAPLEIRLKNRNKKDLPKPEEIYEIASKVSQKSGIIMGDKLQVQDYYEIIPDYERLLLYQVNVNELISVLRKAFNSLQIFSLKQGQYQVPVILAGEEQSLSEIIQSGKVRSKNKESIPLSSLVSVRKSNDYKVLKGGKSDVFISLEYNCSQAIAEKITSAYEQELEAYPHIKMDVDGSLLQNKKLFKELLIILLVALLLLYFILASQFESLLQPFIVLIEIPIDIAGALLLLWLTGNSLNLMAFIGMIVMTGIIINDSILKIDTINRLAKSGHPLMEAIHLGGKRRLKPIIMTSATTILAMTPFLFGDDMGSRLQQPLAWSIVGGMTIGTFVSLYFIPLAYYYLNKKKYMKPTCQVINNFK